MVSGYFHGLSLLQFAATFRRAQQLYLSVSAWMIRMESDLNPTAGAKSASQALKMDINAYAALFLQVHATLHVYVAL